jgi:hypothetical protein
MLKLKEAKIEIEIKSPTELIIWAERFKEACDRFQANAKEIVDSGKSKQNGGVLSSWIDLGDGVTISFSWNPKFLEYEVINI